MTEGKSRSQVFQEQRPRLTEAEMLEAAKQTRLAASFMALPVCVSDGTIPAVAVKWKLGNGNAETILIDRYVATVLRMLIDHLDKNDWTGTALILPDALPQ